MSALDIDAAEYRRLIADSSEPMLVADGDGTVLMASRRALDLFGYGAGEILGTRIEMLLDPSAAKPLADGSENPSWELHGRRKDGAVFLVGMRASRVEHSRQLTIVVLRDLTPESPREEELRIARDRAAAESRTKSKFLATASHDLRQPLQTMRLLNQSLTDAIETPELRELLDWIGGLPLAARREIPGLPPARADVFPAALATLDAVAEIGAITAFHHSLCNLRYGLAAEALSLAQP